jgi:mannose-1-phosphate guanylyltransferase
MLHALVMAGGAGTRFWPESRASQPKQLLRLVDQRTMVRATVERLAGLVPAERVWVATTAALADRIIEELPEVPVERMLFEPCLRNTAPCIGLAALHILRQDAEATMVVVPADHVVRQEERFRSAVAEAAEIVDEAPEWLVTFGIRPTYPAETFGYIERGERFESTPAALGLIDAAHTLMVYRVRQFREKPNAERARQYLARGTFYWNAGIFVWKAQTIFDALRRHQPEISQGLRRVATAVGGPQYLEMLRREFAAMPAISIDYAVMERATDVLVVEAPFEWDDLGSWQALARLLGADSEGNTIAAKHLGMHTSGTIVRGPDDHLIVTLGVQDLIVVHTPEATLVANKRDEESVRQVVEQVRQRGWTEYL